MLSLPESLLLFALHDERGTIHSAAYIGLDDALRGALLAELVLRGHVQMRSTGEARLHSAAAPLQSVLLQTARNKLTDNDSTIDRMLSTLRSRLPNPRKPLLQSLMLKKVLTKGEKDRTLLRDTPTFQSAGGAQEDEMLEIVRRGVADKSHVNRRTGTLIGLIHVCSLWSAILPHDERAAARAAGEWVLGRDALCRSVRLSIHKAQGIWEGPNR